MVYSFSYSSLGHPPMKCEPSPRAESMWEVSHMQDLKKSSGRITTCFEYLGSHNRITPEPTPSLRCFLSFFLLDQANTAVYFPHCEDSGKSYFGFVELSVC